MDFKIDYNNKNLKVDIEKGFYRTICTHIGDLEKFDPYNVDKRKIIDTLAEGWARLNMGDRKNLLKKIIVEFLNPDFDLAGIYTDFYQREFKK